MSVTLCLEVFSGLFYHCISLKTLPDIISKWNDFALHSSKEIIDGCISLQLTDEQKEKLHYKSE